MLLIYRYSNTYGFFYMLNKSGVCCSLSASHDGTVRMWSLQQFSCISSLQLHQLHIISLAFDGRFILTGASDKSV